MPIADLHIHSRYSRATSREGDTPHLDLWARRKGIAVVGTGDCTHPAWREELREVLVDDGSGLYALREGARLADAAPGPAPRFALTGEISSIYKKDGRTRKVHNVVLLPSLEAADRFAARLEKVGNIRSDGRPILGLDSRDLLEILLECDERAVLIPAHIWTPHFSLFGAFSGFDAIEECFGDLTGEIHALETGLSSDPPMNWRVSALDRYLLVSNSDAHSPAKLGREANLLAACDSYDSLRHALRTGEGFLGTVEFFPEEGKYHWDGHRACRVCLQPEEAAALGGKCPVCGKRLTTGVEHRVLELADRPEGTRPASARPFERLVPLAETIGAALGVSGDSAKAQALYEALLGAVGTEFAILREAPTEDIRAVAGELAAEAVRRVRAGQVRLEPGFDGQYGHVTIFTPQERRELAGQTSLFAAAPVSRAKRSGAALPRGEKAEKGGPAPEAADRLNAAQAEAVQAREESVAVIAGPGTGKTRTLVARIERMVREGVRPADITAVTFTNQAAAELRERLEARLGGKSALRGMTVGTFHAVALRLLQDGKRLVGGEESLALAEEAARETGSALKGREALRAISDARLGQGASNPDIALLAAAYERRLAEREARDMDGLLLDALRLKKRPGAHLLVDEFQDTNAAQRRLVAHWSAGGGSLFVIGDADQSIYGFRGASARCFEELEAERPGLRRIRLEENYRSTPEICRAACEVISRNTGGTRSLAPRRPSAAPVRFLEAGSPLAEAVWIAGEIARMAGGLDMLEAHRAPAAGVARAFSEIAVLCRTHRQLDVVEKALRHDDIPVMVLGRGDWLEDARVRECLRFFEGLSAGDIPAQDLWAGWEKEKPRTLLEKWIGVNGSGEAMQRLVEVSVQYADLRALLGAMLLGEEADIRRASGTKRASGAVRLMTIHGAKGLEFPVVFLAGLTEGLFPVQNRDCPVDMEEERRLLFVGMTRARDELIVSGARPLSAFAGEIDLPREQIRAPRRKEPQPQQLSFF